jgi:hypothetical protein
MPVRAASAPIRALIAAAAGCTLALATGALPAAAATGGPAARVIGARDVAGASPYAGRHCNVATPYYTQPGGKEGEPFIAVDPADTARRIAVWMDATRATDDVAYTADGGRTWHATFPRGIDGCTGNHSQAWEASGDPWLSFGPDGVAYLSTLTWAHFVTPPASDYVSVVHVQTSRDGGRTWSEPVFLAGHHAVSDKPMVVADPYRAGVAFEVWRNQSFGMPVGQRGATELLFARTADWGRTWTSPIRIAAGAATDFFGSPQLSVLRGGALVATSSLAAATGGTNLLAYHSSDQGQTWSAPVLIRTAPPGALPAICGQSVAGADTGASSGQQTVVAGHTVVLIAQDGAAAAAGRGALVRSWSSDGGVSWHSSVVLRQAMPLLLASVTAGADGTVGLVWDEIDTAAVNCTTGTIPARTRFADSATLGASWSRPVTVGAPWWNLASGARGTGGFSGYFIGDYQALAAAGPGFTTITVAGRPLVRGTTDLDISGQTGVIVATVALP